MKLLVVGGGGREHAIIRKLKESPRVSEIYAAPGNGGIACDAQCVDIKATDIAGITAFATQNKIGFVVVAPDDPLVLGMTDALEAVGIPCFGPSAAAARIEGSKVFSKRLMKKYGIPTADYECFSDPAKAIDYIKSKNRYPIVIKADGLALGKGVLICENENEAAQAVQDMLLDGKFGGSGSTVVIEEFMTGPEVSVLAFTDGKAMVPMVSSMDHKRALDGDRGLNTGGMGAIAPNPHYTPEVAQICMESIFIPTMAAMNAEGCPFKGCLFFGLMLTPDGPRVIEYNCRFGDPEAQVVLPLLESDLFDIMEAVSQERLSEVSVRFTGGAAACVILASGGYPEKYTTGFAINGLENGQTTDCGKSIIYHAGSKLLDGKLVTAGGRVLGVTATAEGLQQAVEAAYTAADRISFRGLHRRNDIGGAAGVKNRKVGL